MIGRMIVKLRSLTRKQQTEKLASVSLNVAKEAQRERRVGAWVGSCGQLE